ncbi:uncharacterized protein LOC133188077 [Saccostrea echinata]|uniref:uncharacterized protein LOC133188077 n=1 Tax=Saccostrea echinata TaxID=191078 RepID=UPI002A828209|nr:uncharacterized protein LOC133188077 [Saccostrea echinata]
MEMRLMNINVSCVQIWEKFDRLGRERNPEWKMSYFLPVYTGSYSEGMPNSSDMDRLLIAKWINIQEEGTISPDVNENSKCDVMNLFYTTEGCHFGYIKIVISKEIKHIFSDAQIRRFKRVSYMKSDCFIQDMKTWIGAPPLSELHGPSLTYSGYEGFSYDEVYGIKISGWPSLAKSTLDRCNRTTKTALLNSDVYAVPVGYTLSATKDIEWRLLFTMAEKVFMKTWSKTQLNCYYLLKQLKMIHLANPDCLKSYYIKTVLFWMSEALPVTYWCPENLLKLFAKTLLILKWFLFQHWLPNYFIPENNIIDHKPAEECQTVANKISSLLTGRMEVVIAELLCEDQIEDIYDFVGLKRSIIPPRSTKICQLTEKYIQTLNAEISGNLLDEADILSSLTTCTIQNLCQCKAMEEIIEDLPNFLTKEVSGSFSVILRRKVADFYHSQKTRQSHEKAEKLYKDCLSLRYPNGFDDNFISGVAHLAFFYYLNGNFIAALDSIEPTLETIKQSVKSETTSGFLHIAIPYSIDRVWCDKILYDILQSQSFYYPLYINVVSLILYVAIRSLLLLFEPHSKERELLQLTELFVQCGLQNLNPCLLDTYDYLICEIRELLLSCSIPTHTLSTYVMPQIATRTERLKNYHNWNENGPK